ATGRLTSNASRGCPVPPMSDERGTPAMSVGVSGGDQVLVAQCRLERTAPTDHMRMAPQQRPPLALGHTPPHTEFDPVVERVGQALIPHRAAPADPFGDVLLCSLYEQSVRVAVPAGCFAGPVRDHLHLPASPFDVFPHF